MLQNRRSFLKTGTTLVGGVLLTKYIEPIVPIAELKKHEWVEDKGDFYIVRVPDSKTFANELLDKPTIFLLGHHTVVRDIIVNGYANISHKGTSLITTSRFDVSKMLLSTNRSILSVEAPGDSPNDTHITNCHFDCNKLIPAKSIVDFDFSNLSQVRTGT